MSKIQSSDLCDQWRALNTDRNLSSQGRNRSKIDSLQNFVFELAHGNAELSERIEGITQDFFKKNRMPSVEKLLNDYANYIPELQEQLAPLAEVVSNTWKFSP